MGAVFRVGLVGVWLTGPELTGGLGRPGLATVALPRLPGRGPRLPAPGSRLSNSPDQRPPPVPPPPKPTAPALGISVGAVR
ncbi:hypothetical protein GCM10012285_63530 [Streptomyces kronopolitis]|uniref:Uncharacterized protein n=1 Tax=Streptomyces kronopolitis TaxID=1612435 RepID=A0ABQ2K1B9_9ACTN|nr:hypothetical protein GCM10012285_63530 [Streptomyces kronopolitis]